MHRGLRSLSRANERLGATATPLRAQHLPRSPSISRGATATPLRAQPLAWLVASSVASGVATGVALGLATDGSCMEHARTPLANKSLTRSPAISLANKSLTRSPTISLANESLTHSVGTFGDATALAAPRDTIHAASLTASSRQSRAVFSHGDGDRRPERRRRSTPFANASTPPFIGSAVPSTSASTLIGQ